MRLLKEQVQERVCLKLCLKICPPHLRSIRWARILFYFIFGSGGAVLDWVVVAIVRCLQAVSKHWGYKRRKTWWERKQRGTVWFKATNTWQNLRPESKCKAFLCCSNSNGNCICIGEEHTEGDTFREFKPVGWTRRAQCNQNLSYFQSRFKERWFKCVLCSSSEKSTGFQK